MEQWIHIKMLTFLLKKIHFALVFAKINVVSETFNIGYVNKWCKMWLDSCRACHFLHQNQGEPMLNVIRVLHWFEIISMLNICIYLTLCWTTWVLKLM